MTSYASVKDIPTSVLGDPKIGMKNIVMHWTGGSTKVNSIDLEHYHFIIDAQGVIHVGNKPVKANASPSYRAGTYAQHCRNFNENSIGISICGFGDFIPKPLSVGKRVGNEVQVSTMIALAARLSTHHSMPVGPHNVLSHAEVQPTLKIKQNGKIDFVWLPGFNLKTSIDPVTLGNMIRERIRGVRASLIAQAAPQAPKTTTQQKPQAASAPSPVTLSTPITTSTPTPETKKAPITMPVNTPKTYTQPAKTKADAYDGSNKNNGSSDITSHGAPKVTPNPNVTPKSVFGSIVRPLAGKWTYMLSIFGMVNSVVAGLKGANSLPELLSALGPAVDMLGFSPQNAGMTFLGFAAVGTTRMGIAKLLKTIQELWPLIAEVRRLAAEAKAVVDRNNAL